MKMSVSFRRLKGRPKLFMAVLVRSILYWSAAALLERACEYMANTPSSKLFRMEETISVTRQMIVYLSAPSSDCGTTSPPVRK